MNKALKNVKDSIIITHDIVHPSDVNAHEIVFGGHMMSLLDKAACISANKHCNKNVVTISIEGVRFFNSAIVGSILNIYASVNRVFNSSMEVGLKVTAIQPHKGNICEDICKAYMTFVAIDENGKPISVEPINPESDEEKRRFKEAGIRRESRIRLEKELAKDRI